MVGESSKLSNTGHGIITRYVLFPLRLVILFIFRSVVFNQSNTPQDYKSTEVLLIKR